MKNLLQNKTENNTYMEGWYCFYSGKNSIPSVWFPADSCADGLDYFNFGSPVKNCVQLADAGTIIKAVNSIKLFLQ